MQQTLSNKGDEIDKFAQKFIDLKNDFDTGAITQTVLLSLRTQTHVESIG
jgi:hypothetical protein